MAKKMTATVLLLGMFLGVTVVKAEEPKIELSKLGIIDSVELAKSDLDHYERTQLTVKFSEKDDVKIKSNSIITLDLPQALESHKITKEDGIKLISEGHEIGIVYVNDERTQIIAEFNEYVDKVGEIKGKFNFDVTAIFEGEAEEGVRTTNKLNSTLGTNNISLDYSVSMFYNKNEGPFFYKPGGRIDFDDTEHISWWLVINNDKESFKGDITITDTLGKGQALELLDDTKSPSIDNLNTDYFSIERDTSKGFETLTPSEFVDKGYGTITFVNETTFEIKIFKDQDNAGYQVVYKTKITQAGTKLETFYNSAQGVYDDGNDTPIIFNEDNRSVQNLIKGADVVASKGTLKIIKYASDGEEILPLSNAKFQIFNADGTKVAYLKTDIIETNEDGIADTEPLKEGSYYVQEIDAPDFVEFDESIKHPFDINLNKDEGATLKIKNMVKTKNLSVEKVWHDDKDVHQEIKVDLKNGEEIIETIRLNDDSLEYTFKDLPMYSVEGDLINYNVYEHHVDGYTTSYEEDSDGNFKIHNTELIKGTLEAQKLVNVEKVTQGKNFKYTIKVQNTKEGSIPIEIVEVKDTLPKGIHFAKNVISVNGNEITDAIEDDTLNYVIKDLEHGQDITIEFEVFASEVEGKVKNTAVVKGSSDNEPEYPSVEITVLPKEPEEPKNPTGPTGPIDPTDPKDPTGPTGPVDPTEPEKPVDPVDPVEPTEPEKPVDPIDPVEPTEPEKPVDPVDPVEPTDPEKPVDPVDPVDPTEPEKPVDPVDPVEPTDPETPVEPVVPVEPTEPEKPVDPVDPVEPTEPVIPVTPVVPVEPVNPIQPISPVKQNDTKDVVKGQTPNTGIQAGFNYMLIIASAAALFITLLKKKEEN